jgi:phospholipase/carboxylesterase/glyoxalase family protein
MTPTTPETGPELGFVHRFVPAPSAHAPATLVLLHGTGGDESDLLSLGRTLVPDAALLSPRGKVLERGMPRFFRRIAEGVFDEEDLITRARELAEFLRHAAARYAIDPARLIAVGYSNGANIAAALLFLDPTLFHAAVLFRPMVPFEPAARPEIASARLSGTPVLLTAGRMDPIIPAANTDRLAELLRTHGASVSLHHEMTGHQLSAGDVNAARQWLAGVLRGGAPRER